MGWMVSCSQPWMQNTVWPRRKRAKWVKARVKMSAHMPSCLTVKRRDSLILSVWNFIFKILVKLISGLISSCCVLMILFWSVFSNFQACHCISGDAYKAFTFSYSHFCWYRGMYYTNLLTVTICARWHEAHTEPQIPPPVFIFKRLKKLNSTNWRSYARNMAVTKHYQML